MRFLLIEDNQNLSSAVSERLSLDGHVVDQAESLGIANHYLSVSSYDLILLDIMLPDGDGRDFLLNHRKQKNTTPVIVLTARSEISDRVTILDLGADDYMVKPIDFNELEARCRAVLRRRSGEAQNQIKFGDVSFDSHSGTLMTRSRSIQLRAREIRLLEVFFRHPDQIFSKANLVDKLFPLEVDVTENAIEVYILRLRKHIAETNVKITTVRGLGYKLETP
tara:strand:+ start:525 stop:1190 length:666 start_codon:yes stop_codon:yes gene_type:complete